MFLFHPVSRRAVQIASLKKTLFFIFDELFFSLSFSFLIENISRYREAFLLIYIFCSTNDNRDDHERKLSTYKRCQSETRQC